MALVSAGGNHHVQRRKTPLDARPSRTRGHGQEFVGRHTGDGRAGHAVAPVSERRLMDASALLDETAAPDHSCSEAITCDVPHRNGGRVATGPGCRSLVKQPATDMSRSKLGTCAPEGRGEGDRGDAIAFEFDYYLSPGRIKRLLALDLRELQSVARRFLRSRSVVPCDRSHPAQPTGCQSSGCATPSDVPAPRALDGRRLS